jgi:hypothetical protein
MSNRHFARIARSLLTAVCALSAVIASASTIEMETRYYTGGALSSASAYKNTIDALMRTSATSGYGNKTLGTYDGVSNHGSFGSSNNIAFRFEVDFNANVAGNWGLRVGPDFGLGGAVFLDGQAVAFRTNDMWWAGSYANASQDFAFTVNLAKGNHTLLVYGLEACCDGAQQAQFQGPNASAYTTFSSTDGHNPATLPEPGSLPLMAVAGIGLVALQRKSALSRFF